MDNSFFDSADRLFAQECTPAIIRQIEQGADTTALWAMLESSGFGDALLPESAAGAGLTLSDVWPILFCMGRHAVPLPLAQTMLARAWLNQAQQVCPEGPVTFAPFQVSHTSQGLRAHAVSFGKVASWVLAQLGSRVWLLPVAFAESEPSGAHGSLDADLFWANEIAADCLLGEWDAPQFQDLQALSLAVLIAGAADRAFEMTLEYACQRVQFGKPIGKFQALQQQVSEVAEQVFGARMASQMSCRSDTWQPQQALAALAKLQASQSVARIAAVAHAVHGAIGVTYEYDLQLYTRRLHEWVRAGAGPAYWAQILGRHVLKSELNTVDFIRTVLFSECSLAGLAN